MELYSLSADTLGQLLRGLELTSEDVCGTFLRRIERTDGPIGAFASVRAAQALDDARRVDARRACGEALPDMAGVPVALCEGLGEDGELLAGCEAAGLVVLGWTAGETARNPYDTRRLAGGGAAACLAVGQAPLVIGTNETVALRAAAYCGVMGLRLTNGHVIMARCVADIERMLEALRETKTPAFSLCERETCLGLPAHLFTPDMDADVEAEIHFAVHCLEDAGTTPVDLDADETAFQHCEIVVAPGLLHVAPRVEEGLPARENDILEGMAGMPAMALPGGFAHALPVGVRLMAPCGHERPLLNLAKAYEQLTGPAGLARLRDVDTLDMQFKWSI